MASVLTVLLFLFAFGNRVTSDGGSTSFCLTNPLPSDLTEWPSSGTNFGSTVTALWSFDKVCSKFSTCYNVIVSDGSDINFINQLPPVQIRPDQIVVFSAPSAPNGSPVALEYFQVNEFGFQNCETNGSQPLDVTSDNSLSLNNGRLQLGNNYFIANGINDTAGFAKCSPYGLRLNITVQYQNCSQNPSGTSGNLCSGQGRCVVRKYEPYYNCRCCSGFIGDYCKYIDGCLTATCQNGGTCIDDPNDLNPALYVCNCLPGYTGTNCEDEMGVICPTNECMHGGHCRVASDISIGFRCYCPQGYTGKVCETNINECNSNPCVKGYCTNLVDAYNCTCLPDYSGVNCETYIGACPVGRCLNGGTCQPIPETNSSICLCYPGFTGLSCETRVPLCHTNSCVNHIDCVDTGYSFKCICNPGYTGVYCEVNVNECASNPCKNNGTCNDLIAAFSCNCPEGFEPPVCDIAPDNSTAEPLPKPPSNALVGLTIAAAVLGSLVGVALIVLLIYFCAVHKPYKRFRLSRKYVHVVDETYGPSTEPVDITGAHPSPDFVAEPSSGDVDFSTGSAKSPLVRRQRPSKTSRI